MLKRKKSRIVKGERIEQRNKSKVGNKVDKGLVRAGCEKEESRK